MLTKEKGIKSATIYLDNQAVIQSITHIKPRPAQHILEQAHNMANQAAKPTRRRQVRLRIRWISGHDGVEGNEAADAEAKEASTGDSSTSSELPTFLQSDELPHSVAATRQTFRMGLRRQWRERWQTSPRYARINKIDNTLPSKSYHKETAGLTRAQTSLITQLRTGHIPLNRHLHRIKRATTPICPACSKADETVHHYLFECRPHEHARHGLRKKLGRKSASIKELLGRRKGILALLRYVADTRRLEGAFGDVTPILNEKS
jgi:hypothetical protein